MVRVLSLLLRSGSTLTSSALESIPSVQVGESGVLPYRSFLQTQTRGMAISRHVSVRKTSGDIVCEFSLGVEPAVQVGQLREKVCEILQTEDDELEIMDGETILKEENETLLDVMYYIVCKLEKVVRKLETRTHTIVFPSL